jgi:hypothetical protein
VASYVAAWLLRKNIDRHGLTWHGVAAYHSLTPEHNQRYQSLLMKALYPDVGANQRAASAVKSASATAHAGANTSANTNRGANANSNVNANTSAALSPAQHADAGHTLLADRH